MTDDGLAAVPVGSSDPLWVLDGAVAAPDGSAIFATVPSAEAGPEVARIDPRTGAAHRIGPLRRTLLGVHVAAVEPGGGRVALAATVADRTEVIDIDIARGVDHAKVTSFEGDVEPEAYSRDRTLLFAARVYGDRYHVHVLELATGEQWPTVGPDKTLPPEDMYGSVVQAVLSPDGAQLATLYRDSTETDHTAFVHLLDLERGQTVCIDLYAPFGTGGPGSDALGLAEGRNGGHRAPRRGTRTHRDRHLRPRRHLGGAATTALPRRTATRSRPHLDPRWGRRDTRVPAVRRARVVALGSVDGRPARLSSIEAVDEARRSSYRALMNEAHEHCGSDEWRAMIRDVILPWAMGEVDLGDDVLEVGPGYGATTDVLSTKAARLTSVEIDEQLAAMLTERFAEQPTVEIVRGDATDLTYPDRRFTGAACFTMLHHVPSVELQDRLFAEVARVLQPGAALVASDSLGSAELEAHHEGDTYNPVDPDSLHERFRAAGFADAEVRTNPFGWAAVARTPS